jgi:O-methyltransferase
VPFDLPHVTQNLDQSTPRLKIQTGDFFKDTIPACDCYILKDVIHDWNDADSLRILSAIRRSARAGATLLLVESVIPEDAGPSFVKLFDVHMMLVGGSQRTKRQFQQLYQGAEFAFERVLPTRSRLSIIEGSAI